MIRWPLKYKIKLYIIYSKMIGDVYAMLALWHQKTLSKVFLCLHTNWTLNLVHLKDCRESCYLSFPKRNTTHYSLFINLYYFTTSFKFPATELFLLFMDVYPGRQALGLHSCKDTCLFFFFLKICVWKGCDELMRILEMISMHTDHTADFPSLKRRTWSSPCYLTHTLHRQMALHGFLCHY